MITVYIWEPGEFRISPSDYNSPASDFITDWKNALGHASMHISSTNTYLSLWPKEAPVTGNPIRKFTVETINLLKSVGGVTGDFKDDLDEDIDAMERGYDKAFQLSVFNENAVSEAANAIISQGSDYEYNLITNNCSTAVLNALHTGTVNIERNRVKDLKGFGTRAMKLFGNATVLTGMENFSRVEMLQTAGFTPVDMVLSLGELMTFRTPVSIAEYIQGMKIFQG